MKYETYDFYTATSAATYTHISKSKLIHSYSDAKVVGEYIDADGNELSLIPQDSGWYVDFWNETDGGVSLLLDDQCEVVEVIDEWN